MTAKEYLRANEYVPNEFGTYVYQNKQGGQHSVNLEAILEDYSNEKFCSLQRELEAEKGANIDEIEMLRNLSDQETSSLRKELEEAKEAIKFTAQLASEKDDVIAEERAKSASLKKELDEAKESRDAIHRTMITLFDERKEERAKSAKLVEALKENNRILKEVNIFMEQENMNADFDGVWRDSEDKILHDVKKALSEYEGKGGGNG